MTGSSCKVAFLDRDGTINVDHGYVYQIENWELTAGAIEAVGILQDAGFRIAVVTNQSGISSGMYSESEVNSLHSYMQQEFETMGVRIDAVALCPHARDSNCNCRKPRIGMVAQIAAQLGQPINYQASWTIGDKLSDVGFGAALDTNTALIRSRYWSDDDIDRRPTLIAESLFEVAERIIARL